MKTRRCCDVLDVMVKCDKAASVFLLSARLTESGKLFSATESFVTMKSLLKTGVE